eukprot:TRINITY_DN11806_c0_g2_i3.p1 TRINITY_DN11806_c0_g2~~TRINITY_DN11806_c0_g2_i3.p1  ORF type:complete len:299 (-),score=43.51 TRINITY_DN11806_c0_g2_i3:42-938(-)
MPKEYGPVTSFALGGLSGAFACILSNPFEVVKTRFQLQGELSADVRPYRSVGHAFTTILAKEGIAGVQRGLVAGITFQTLFNGVRIGLFDHVKSLVHIDAAPAASRLVAGALTGCMAAATCSPLFMVKCRLQAQVLGQGTAVGTQHGYTGLLNGLASVYREGGFSLLYRGVDGFVLRTAVGSAFQLSVFDSVKGSCQEQFGSWPGTLIAAASAGAVATTAMNPFDVVSTRLYNQPRLESGAGSLYSGPVDCFIKSIRTEGISVLGKGWVTHTCRLVPHTVYCLVFFEKIKEFAAWAGF